jgi:hypothetical protein
MQTYMVIAPAVAPLLEYDPGETPFSVTTRPFKELEMFCEGQRNKLSGLKSELQDVKGRLR